MPFLNKLHLEQFYRYRKVAKMVQRVGQTLSCCGWGWGHRQGLPEDRWLGCLEENTDLGAGDRRESLIQPPTIFLPPSLCSWEDRGKKATHRVVKVKQIEALPCAS